MTAKKSRKKASRRRVSISAKKPTVIAEPENRFEPVSAAEVRQMSAREKRDAVKRASCALILAHRIAGVQPPPLLRMDDDLRYTNKHRMASVARAMVKDGAVHDFNTAHEYAKKELLIT